MQVIKFPYIEFDSINSLPDTFELQDHHSGYDKNFKNISFEKLGNRQHTIIVHNIVDNQIKKNYPNLKFVFDANFQYKINLRHFENYNIHPKLDYQNFVCSFNGSDHDSRQLLSSILENQGYFNPKYSSKNFAISNDKILGHFNNLDLTEDEIELYDKFFKTTEKFNDTVYSFGHVQYDHANNIYNLQEKLTQSFVHIVSETLATSYYPFVTEKFLYSIVTRGLFLTYAQPGWHAHIKKYYGFNLYDKIFDYSFDCIQNPVKRLIKLIEMISKFSTLSADDWRDLYFVLEKDTIEYNYNHYFSGNYLKHMKQFDIVND
jgi:hypothetical protein